VLALDSPFNLAATAQGSNRLRFTSTTQSAYVSAGASRALLLPPWYRCSPPLRRCFRYSRFSVSQFKVLLVWGMHAIACSVYVTLQPSHAARGASPARCAAYETVVQFQVSPSSLLW
jgi:hypothetical protein